MQYDMHYYGTYAMAYAAGITVDDAQVIATSAQLVDDNNFTELYKLSSGEGVEGVATAHHPFDAGRRALNIGVDDSRKIWVPFHFLPGNEGESFEERVVCRKNSQLAQTMVNYYTDAQTIESHRGHCLQLMGIGAHVYADTFSHYGFSGLTSELNNIDANTIQIDENHSKEIASYVWQRLDEFKDKFLAKIADTVLLGHGAVATFPDRPFLKWSYLTADGVTRLERNNPSTFLEGCHNLYEYFSRFRSVYYPREVQSRTSFEQISQSVSEVLSTEADATGRAQAWIDAMKAGKIGASIDTPTYSDTRWIESLKSGAELQVRNNRVASDGYNFFVAADYHRNYVLKRLLPEAGMFVA